MSGARTVLHLSGRFHGVRGANRRTCWGVATGVALGVATLSRGASQSSNVTGPTPPAAEGCGIGPLNVSAGAGCGPAPQGWCPLIRPAAAVDVYSVRTCSFGSASTGCEPTEVPVCARDRLSMHLTLVDPGPPQSLCGGELTLAIGQHVEWVANDSLPAAGGGCLAEPSRRGSAALPATCCESFLDIPYDSFTVRIAIRRDWVPR